MQILQITDRICTAAPQRRLRGVETDSSLHAALDDAFARVPDYRAVLVTGDLVQDDKSGYLRFRSFFGNLTKPVLCIPGNHDEPEAMRKELSRRAVQDLRRARNRRLDTSSCWIATIRAMSAAA